MTPREQSVIDAVVKWHTKGGNVPAMHLAASHYLSRPPAPSITIWRFADAPQEYRSVWAHVNYSGWIGICPASWYWDTAIFGRKNTMTVYINDDTICIFIIDEDARPLEWPEVQYHRKG